MTPGDPEAPAPGPCAHGQAAKVLERPTLLPPTPAAPGPVTGGPVVRLSWAPVLGLGLQRGRDASLWSGGRWCSNRAVGWVFTQTLGPRRAGCYGVAHLSVGWVHPCQGPCSRGGHMVNQGLGTSLPFLILQVRPHSWASRCLVSRGRAGECVLDGPHSFQAFPLWDQRSPETAAWGHGRVGGPVWLPAPAT